MDVIFTCEAKKLEGQYEYSYTWKSAILTEPPIICHVKSEAVRQALQKGLDKGEALIKLNGSPKTATLRAQKTPKYAITLVEFLDERGKAVVATGVIGIYEPKSDPQ